MKILLIDNYDSFTFNLYHYLSSLNTKVDVFRNDEINHKNIAYKKGATKEGFYTLIDKVIKTGSKLAIKISEKI